MVVDRPLFSDRDEDDDEFAGPRDQTDPQQPLMIGDNGIPGDDLDGPTGRFDLRSMDDLDALGGSDLPSAHISELDVSDLDGDVVGPGARTAIMQLPPSMMRDAVADNGEEIETVDPVELMKWRSGPKSLAPQEFVPPPVADEHASIDDDNGLAVTIPALSLEAVRAAAAAAAAQDAALEAATGRTAFDADDDDGDGDDDVGGAESDTDFGNAPTTPTALKPPPLSGAPGMAPNFAMPPGTPPPMPLPPPPPTTSTTASTAPASSALPATLPALAPPSLAESPAQSAREAIDDALKAVLAAQSLADRSSVAAGVHRNLSRAVERLSVALDLLDD
jgi:hypothetical protein